MDAFLLFGTGLGTAFHMYMACRSGQVGSIARVAGQVVLADWIFIAPTGLLQPVTGIWLVHLAGHDFHAPWLVISYLLYGVAGVAWLIVVKLQFDMRRLAAGSAASGAGLPAAFAATFATWVRLGWVGFTSLIGVYILMVAKPALW